MDTSSVVTGTVSDAASDLLSEDTVGARAYLRASFLSAAVLALWNARKEAGLTQSEVAARLGTKQSAIARMEADFSGAMSLHRYVDYCVACGALPFDIQLGKLDELREFTRFNVEAPRTPETYLAWARQDQPAATFAGILASGRGLACNWPYLTTASRRDASDSSTHQHFSGWTAAVSDSLFNRLGLGEPENRSLSDMFIDWRWDSRCTTWAASIASARPRPEERAIEGMSMPLQSEVAA